MLWESIRNVIGDFRHRSWGFFILGLEVVGVRLWQMTLFFWLRDVGLALYQICSSPSPCASRGSELQHLMLGVNRFRGIVVGGFQSPSSVGSDWSLPS